MNDDLTAGPDPALVRQAYRKRKVGQSLTPEERKALAQQQKTYANRRTMVYFETDEQMSEWQARAKAQNYTSFSQWIVDRVQRAETGNLIDPVQHGNMQHHLQTLQKEIEDTRQRDHELVAENRELRAEIRHQSTVISELATKIGKGQDDTTRQPKVKGGK